MHTFQHSCFNMVSQHFQNNEGLWIPESVEQVN